MEEKKVNTASKDSTGLLWLFIAALMLGILFTTIFFALPKMLGVSSTYYKEQAQDMCALANAYRNLTIQARPDLEQEIPEALDCNMLLSPEVSHD